MMPNWWSYAFSVDPRSQNVRSLIEEMTLSLFNSMSYVFASLLESHAFSVDRKSQTFAVC